MPQGATSPVRCVFFNAFWHYGLAPLRKIGKDGYVRSKKGRYRKLDNAIATRIESSLFDDAGGKRCLRKRKYAIIKPV